MIKIQFNSLKARLYIYFLGLTLFSILILGSLSIYLSFRTSFNNILNIEKNLNSLKIKEIELILTNLIETLKIIIPNNYNEIAYIPKEQYIGNFIKILQEIINQFSGILEITYINLDGQEELKFIRENNQVKESLENLGNFSEFTLFHQAKKEEFGIGEVRYTLNGPLIEIFVPVKTKDNVVIAVLMTKFFLNDIVETIKKSKLGSSGYVYLLDQNNYLIAHSRRNNYGDLNFSSLINKIPANHLATYNNFGKKVYGSYLIFNLTNWKIVSEWPVNEADQLVFRQVYLIIFIVLLAAGVALFISIIFINHIIRPINILKESAQKVGAGKFEKIEKFKADEEIKILIEEFNKMVDGLIQLQKLKDEFVFMASHELKAPVAALKGYLTLILEGTIGKVDETAKAYLLKMKSSIERLLQLVHDLLEVSRAEAGVLSLNLKPINIDEAVKSAIEELSSLANKKNIQINYQPLENLPQVMGDLERLKEVMINLISNAIKYNYENGKVNIFYEIKEEELITNIQDTGFGIPKDQQEKIFQKFFRAQSKLSANIEGTGLGLFIVKQLIEKMNGKIWFVSEENKGSTFSFSLKIAK